MTDSQLRQPWADDASAAKVATWIDRQPPVASIPRPHKTGERSPAKAAWIAIFAPWLGACIWASAIIMPRHLGGAFVTGFIIAASPLLYFALWRHSPRMAITFAAIGIAGTALAAAAHIALGTVPVWE